MWVDFFAKGMWVDFLQKFSLQLFKINWRRQGGVSKIETKQAAGKLEGWKTLGADFSRLLLEVLMDRSILGIPETQPTIGIFSDGATSCYFFPVPFRIFRFFSSRWKSPSVVFFQSLVWVFPKIVVPQNVWFIMENPIKMGWFGGYHHLRKHPYRCWTLRLASASVAPPTPTFTTSPWRFSSVELRREGDFWITSYPKTGSTWVPWE